MSIFSAFFSSKDTPHNKSSSFDSIKELLNDEAEFYTDTTLVHLSNKRVIKQMMLHPRLGVVLFNYFHYNAKELKGASVSIKQSQDQTAEVKTQEDKAFIQHRSDEIFHQPLDQ